MDQKCIDPTASVRYCSQRYGAYGLFATYCLRTAVTATDVYTSTSFVRAFLRSGDRQCNDPKLKKVLELVEYEDSDYFSFSEIRFLLQIAKCCSPRSDAQLDRDYSNVTREITLGKNILPSHAKALAKAIEYWKLRYNEKYDGWLQKSREAFEAWRLRAELRELFQEDGKRIEASDMDEDSGCESCG